MNPTIPHMSAVRFKTQRWNREHPDTYVPLEWVEEAVISFRDWRQGAEDPHAALDRHQEFCRRIPDDLICELF